MNTKSLGVARIIMTVLTVTAIALIFFNSSLSAEESTEQSSPLTDWVNSITMTLPIPFSVTENLIRKLAHFTEYTILGTLLSTTVYLYRRDPLKTLLTTVPIGAAVAVCDELIQLIPVGRSCEVRDMLIDSGGILFGTLIVTLIVYLSEKKHSKRKVMK